MSKTAFDQLTYCMACRDYTTFARPPVEVLTRIGARPRLKGRCAACGQEMSRFLPSDDGPTSHNVRVGESTWREIQRAATLLDCQQRAIVENLVLASLVDFATGELDRLADAGVITVGERDRRLRELERPVEDWRPRESPESQPSAPGSLPVGLLQQIAARLRRGQP